MFKASLALARILCPVIWRAK